MADLISMLAAASGAGGEVDPNFNQTVLLLHGDGTNGAQNNTFLDSGTANAGSGFTITRNGNTTQGTFSPFSAPDGRWGNFFDGSSNLQVSNNSAFRFDTGDFTIEFWLYYSGSSWTGSNQSIASQIASDTVTGWGLFRDNGGTGIAARLGSSISNYITLFTGSVPATGVWEHYALVRNGSTVTWYKNGTNVASTTAPSGNISDTTQPFYVSNTQWGAKLNGGYISNLRVVKGTALYTSAFTPSTAPLTNITNTSLLTCQSNRFVDNSSNAFAVTISGTPKVTPFSPFATTAAYDASVNGGSGYFDGTGDYLNAGASADFNITSGDFTVELFLYRTTSGTEQYLFSQRSNSPSSGWEWRINATNFMSFFFVGGSIVTGSTAVPSNSWVHIAVTRSTNTVRLFINGVEDTSATFSNGTSASTVNLLLGAGTTGGGVTVGYWASARLIKGTALYTSAFTPPTAPLTAVSGTSLLLNFTNAGIFDNTGKNNLETVADAQIDTTTKKYGTGSMEFDGTGDYLVMKDTPEMVFGTGDFTIEFWVNTNQTANEFAIIDFRAANGAFPFIAHDSTRGVFYYLNTNYRIESNTVLTTGVWYHIAVARSGSSTKLFINGTQAGSTFTDSTSLSVGANRPIIGTNGANVGTLPLNGFIDDLRITKGVARYTTTFTPPTKAFPDL